MKLMLIIFTICTISPTVAQQNQRPESEKLDLEMREIVSEFLARDCFVGIFELEIPLQHAGSRLEAVFWEAYVLGPRSRELEARSAALDNLYKSYRQWLSTEGQKVLGITRWRQLSSISKEEFISTGITKYTQQYKDAALTGLGIICSPACDTMLQRIADNQKLPARFAAKAARERLRSRL